MRNRTAKSRTTNRSETSTSEMQSSVSDLIEISMTLCASAPKPAPLHVRLFSSDYRRLFVHSSVVSVALFFGVAFLLPAGTAAATILFKRSSMLRGSSSTPAAIFELSNS